MSQYEKTIQDELARRGRPEVSARWVEAWIRLELGVLDWLFLATSSAANCDPGSPFLFLTGPENPSM
jgi:hypothetical protein